MSSLTGITETEDLTLFIRERMQAYDPSVDTTTGSSYHNTVLQPLLDRLGPDPYNTPIREFCIGRLSVEFPDMVLQDGEPIDDLVIKPMQILLEAFRRQIQQISNNQSLEDPSVLNEREADALGGNFFVRRRPGGLSVGVARLYFSAPQAAIVTPNNAVYDGVGQRFFPVENQGITADNMLFNVEDNLYYMDIVVRAEEEGASYNIDYNTLIGIEEFESSVKVTNKSAFEEGDDKETTEEYIERVENSLTEKSLVTFRGITARLTDVFETIRLIQVIGHGDPEMNRDILVGEPSAPAPYAFFLGSTGRIDLSGDTNDGITASGTDDFTDSDATFQTDGVAGGFILRILTGLDAGDWTIAAVPSETQIDVVGSFTDTSGGLSYEIVDPTTAGPYIDLGSASGNILLADGSVKTSFPLAEARIGDVVTYADPASGVVTQHTITSTDDESIRVSPDIQGDLINVPLLLGRPTSQITISDIPGGILQPDENGELIVEPGELHLGGAVDVFVRAGAPVAREIILEGVLDGSPLHFGVDLESFGERADEFIHVTKTISDLALRSATDRFGGAVTDHILVQVEAGEQLTLTGDQNDGAVDADSDIFTDLDAVFETDGVAPGHIIVLTASEEKFEVVEVVSNTQLRLSEVFASDDTGLVYEIYTNDAPWIPTDDDIGRYIELLPSGAPGTLGLLEILTIESREYIMDSGVPKECVRITVDVTENHYDPGNPYTLGSSGSFDVDFRIVEKVSIKSRVRDRDGTRTITGSYKTGSDLWAIGARIGDSVVIETGDDAGIYSIRRILSWLNTNDTLILDRDLTKTHTPIGNGDGSGLRYRIADELNVDLVAPKVTKIPLGNIFAGDDLSTVAGSPQVLAGSSSNFLLAGVEIGDTLEILSGDDTGTYSIVSVTGTTLTVDAPLQNTAPSLDFSIYLAFAGIDRPMVRVKEVELLDSSSQPTGIFIPYGDAIDARALGVFSNRAEGSQQESFTGQTQLGTGSLEIRLYDAEVDFAAEGAVPGWRLNVLNTENEGRYTILRVGTGDGLPSDNHIEVTPASAGGVEFVERTSAVHYTIGIASAGVARLYFQEPTTVEITTGLSGGRINYEEEGTPKEYHFSEVDGYRITPPAGEAEEVSRDIRVTRSYETSVGSGLWESILELTDSTAPGVFEQEFLVGDLVEINEQIPFRDSGGTSFRHLGIFGAPAGLRTVAGSNRVTVPSNSLIDFTAMDSIYPLAGQILYIDAGADEGQYVIEEVVDSKTLRLSQVLTGTTETTIHQESSGLRDATLIANVNTITLQDLTDNPGTQIGNYITIFESTRGDIDGVYEIKSIPGASQVELDMNPSEFEQVGYVTPPIIPFGTGLFSWVNTTGEENVGHAFRIYKTVPTQAEIVKVATQRDDLNLEGVGDISGTPRIDFEDTSATFQTSGVVPGDQIEILAGPSVGTYAIASVPSETTLQIVNNASTLFPTSGSSNPYKIWSGLHGSRTMLTVGPFESDNGFIPDGEFMPFKILRPGVFRVSSTEMEENVDGGFYYVDIQVESLGSGDEFNLDRLDRMVVQSGMEVDGYTHTVENNNLTFSTFEQVSLNFDRRFLPVGNSDSPDNMTEISGRNLKVVYENSTTTRLVHDLMRSDTERPINANPLARHFLPSYVYVQLYYRGGPSDSDVGPVVEDYINSLGALDELEVSDLEAFIARRDADSIDHPIVLAVITHDIDRALVVNRTESRLGGELEVPYNGTGRISCFFATLGEGLIVEKRS